MKKRMYVGLFMLLFYLIFAVTALPITANADIGPKPSVRIQFKNMSEICAMARCFQRRNVQDLHKSGTAPPEMSSSMILTGTSGKLL